ncbi:MAG: ankyrin repeat domain-containing protein [bacterium]
MNLARDWLVMICSATMTFVNRVKVALSWAVVVCGLISPASGSEIHEAAKAGLEEVVTVLLEAQPSLVNEAAGGGLTPLHVAAVYGQTGMAAFLLKKGANLEARMDSDFTPLHCAVMKEHPDTVKLLLEKGADVKAVTRGRLTCLHIAVQKGNMAILRMLLNTGVDIRAKTKDGMTPLDLAADKNAVEMVEVLTETMKQRPTAAKQSGVPGEGVTAVEPQGNPGGQKPGGTVPGATNSIAAEPVQPSVVASPAERPVVERVEPMPESVIGDIRFGDGAVYSGGLLKGKMHGYGVLTFQDGEKYDGQWIENEKHGEGKATFPNGEFYLGEWRHNKKNGRGMYSFPNGERYEGQWVADRMHGAGVYIFADGTKLEGQWVEDSCVTKAGESSAVKQ